MAEFVMPQLGADMEAGTLNTWFKKPGDFVQRGDIVAEVETDKGVIEVEVFATGVLEEFLVQPGERVPVGTVLATVREEGAPHRTSRETATPVQSRVAVKEPVAVAAPPVLPRKETAEVHRLRISPSARQLARNLGVDPTTVKGTGPGGAITREDIEKAAEQPKEAPAAKPVAEDASARMRRAIAAAMTRSKREVPHYYLSTTVDLHRALTWLTEQNEKRPVTGRLLPGTLFLKAVALALRDFPELNSLWKGEHCVASEAIHVGVAIALRKGGLVAPALHNTDQLSFEELMEKFRDLVQRARAGSLRASEFSDPTITVTSLGDQGVESAFGVIYPPQVAIVGFGKVMERPWVVDGQIVPRPVVTVTLSADHRVSDGHRGGLFLAAIDRLLQEPGKL